MLTAVQVENFRCFKTMELKDFGLVNIIVGANASGKTALLESIFLGAGTPDVDGIFRYWRSVGALSPIPNTRAAYEAVFEDLFFGFNSEQTITLKLEGTPQNARTVRIYYEENTENVVAAKPKGAGATGYSGTDLSAISPLVFEVNDGKGTHKVRAVIGENGMVGTKADSRPAAPLTLFFVATLMADPTWCAQLFSNLSAQNREQEFTAAFNKVFPDVKDIGVLSPNGIPGVYANVPHIGKKVALGFVSTGMLKLAGILLGITGQRDGVALIDELESGFHYKKFPEVWEAVVTFARDFNCQLFVSTHSAEFLSTLAPLITENPKDFRLLRAEKGKDGRHVVKVFKGKDFESALEIGTEIR